LLKRLPAPRRHEESDRAVRVDDDWHDRGPARQLLPPQLQTDDVRSVLSGPRSRWSSARVLVQPWARMDIGFRVGRANREQRRNAGGPTLRMFGGRPESYRGSARSGRPGSASGTSSPSRTTASPPTSRCFTPTDGRVEST